MLERHQNYYVDSQKPQHLWVLKIGLLIVINIFICRDEGTKNQFQQLIIQNELGTKFLIFFPLPKSQYVILFVALLCTNKSSQITANRLNAYLTRLIICSYATYYYIPYGKNKHFFLQVKVSKQIITMQKKLGFSSITLYVN